MPGAIVIYDSDCGFCKWSLALLLRWDGVGRRRSAVSGALRPLPLGTPEAGRHLVDLPEAERNASWHVVVQATPSASAAGAAPRCFSAGAALAPTLSLLPGGRLPAWVFARFPHATERGYRWVAEHRGLLGRFVPARARRWADRVIAAHRGPA